MALLFFDGFEHDDWLSRWDNATATFVGTYVRTGVQAAYFNSGGDYLIKNLSSTSRELVVGFAYFHDNGAPWNYYEISTSDGVDVTFGLYYSGTWQLKRGTISGTVVASGFSTIISETWYYYEFKVKIDDSTGYVIVKRDNLEIANETGLDTCYQNGSGNISSIKILQVAGSGHIFHLDDFYVCDTTGSQNNDFLGPVGVYTLRPNGNGYNSDFTGSDADSTDNYLHVDEATVDDDTSYIESSTLNAIDSFTYEDMPASPTSIHGVILQTVAKKDQTENRQYTPFVRLSSTNYDGTEKTLDNGTYISKFDLWEQNPNTATAWDETGVNAIEAGIEITT